ncbi:MAG: DNA polymerase III delta subunit [Rhodothermales bacterium]|jgi:DNA polymerase III delta subunit
MATILLFTGSDEPTVRQKAKAAVAKLAGPEPDDFSFEIHKESDELPPEQIINELASSLLTPSMFGGSKTVWLSGFTLFDKESCKTPLGDALARLAELISEGLPEEINLVMSGKGIDKRRKIYKAVNSVGKVHYFDKPELRNFRWREEVGKIIAQQAAERRMTLPVGAVEYLTEVVGVDTARIASEMEKIFCYSGTQPALDQIQEICVGNREALFFALSDAFGKRDINMAIRTMSQYLSHVKDPEGAVIGQVRLLSKYFRQLLHAKLLMTQLRVRSGELGNAIGRLGKDSPYSYNSLVGGSPWLVKRIAAQADKYSGAELVRAIGLLARFDKSLVSSPLPRRTLLETLAVQIILGQDGRKAKRGR